MGTDLPAGMHRDLGILAVRDPRRRWVAQTSQTLTTLKASA